MLQENEVRIGNAVKDSTGRIGSIMSIGKNQVRVRFEFSTVKIDTNHDETGLDIEAIPLTDEILLKAGFKELNYGWYAKEYFTDCREAAEVMSIQYNLTTGRCGIGDTDFGGCNAMTGKSFHSLHQLQNLAYSLTGSELEVVW